MTALWLPAVYRCGTDVAWIYILVSTGFEGGGGLRVTWSVAPGARAGNLPPLLGQPGPRRKHPWLPAQHVFTWVGWAPTFGTCTLPSLTHSACAVCWTAGPADCCTGGMHRVRHRVRFWPAVPIREHAGE